MIEIRFHGFGGQGVVLAAHLVGKAALKSGLCAHSFPFFSTAMRGGTVTAFARIDDGPIDRHCFVEQPDLLVLFHEMLLQLDEPLTGMKPRGTIVVNTRNTSLELPEHFTGDLFMVDGDRVAQENLGRRVLSTVMAAAVLRALEGISLDSLTASVGEAFSAKIAKANTAACERAFESTHMLERSSA